MLVEYKGEVKLVYGIQFRFKLRFLANVVATYIIREWNPELLEAWCRFRDESLDREYIEKYPRYFEVIKAIDDTDVRIIDPRLPLDWIFLRHRGWSVAFELFPKGFENFRNYYPEDGFCYSDGEMLLENFDNPMDDPDFCGSVFSADNPHCYKMFEERFRYGETLIANEMLKFHGLPPIEIPPDEIPGEREPVMAVNEELQKDLEYSDK